MRQNRFPPPSKQTEPPPPPPSQARRVRQRLGRWRDAFLVLASVLVALGLFLAYDASKPPPQRLTQADIDAAVVQALASAPPEPSHAAVAYAIIRPSTVRIEVMLPGSASLAEGGVGAGVVIDDRGTILASLHVVEHATGIRVTFADGTESPAAVVARQPENDLAVLRPEMLPDDLIPATLAGSAGLQVGDEVVAVGNPYGISNSTTAGVVSGLGRNYRSPSSGERLSNLIQFDAAVNPGNSGGPLVNRNGEVVGIVTGLYNPTEQSVFIGIGFAVPIETAAEAAGEVPL